MNMQAYKYIRIYLFFNREEAGDHSAMPGETTGLPGSKERDPPLTYPISRGREGDPVTETDNFTGSPSFPHPAENVAGYGAGSSVECGAGPGSAKALKPGSSCFQQGAPRPRRERGMPIHTCTFAQGGSSPASRPGRRQK